MNKVVHLASYIHPNVDRITLFYRLILAEGVDTRSQDKAFLLTDNL